MEGRKIQLARIMSDHARSTMLSFAQDRPCNTARNDKERYHRVVADLKNRRVNFAVSTSRFRLWKAWLDEHPDKVTLRDVT
jgi:hypothetical protein